MERQGGAVVARLSGEVDMTNAATCASELLEVVPNDVLALVVDLDDCRYLDSAAIEVIFDLSGASSAAARSCVWWCPTRRRSGASWC